MQQTVIEGIRMWSAWQPERGLSFNSFFIEDPAGNLAVDPLPLPDADAAEIESRGGFAWIVITNRDHERDARALASRFGAKIAASKGDAPHLSGPVDRTLGEGDALGSATVLELDGMKTAGEIALYLKARRTLVVGDALWGDPAGSVRLMPDDKLRDPARAGLSLRRLRALHPAHLLVGDGACLFSNAFEALNAALAGRRDPGMARINVDEFVFQAGRGDPSKYGSQWMEVGFLLGATKLGYLAAHIPPGTSFCPNHWHTAEEELFIVWEGTPTLRVPHGEIELRRGDVVAFVTGGEGAHQIFNRGDAPCTLLMVANTSPDDVCFYPDSKKVLVEATGLLVRSEPELDYFDGE